MNEAEIRRYASLMRELDLTGMEIDEKKGVIRLEREKDSSGGSAFLDGAKAQGMDEFSGNSAPSAGTEFLGNAAAANTSVQAGGLAGVSLENGSVLDSVTSPTVGVFYAAPAENADPYVKVGDVVHKGTVLCIIEAMKLMNEVLAEKDGVIEAICAKNGQIVEYGTELVRIKELSA